MKKICFIILSVILSLALYTISFASSKNLSASWKCVDTYDTSDVIGSVDIYDYVYSVRGAGRDGISVRESDFELKAGDVIDIYANSEFDSFDDPVPEYNSADHFIYVYCGDKYLDTLRMPILNSYESSDHIKVTVPEKAISKDGKNNLILEYQIGSFHSTLMWVDSIYINGEYLECEY